MFAAVSEDRFVLALNLVYDTAVAPARWPELLSSLAGLFDSHFADTFSRTDDFSRYRGLAHGMAEAEYQTEFLDGWVKRNAWGKRHPARIAGEVVSTRDMVSVAALKRDAMYGEFLQPRGLHEGLRLVVWAGEGWIRDISLLRPWSAGPFAGPEKALAGVLMPHIRRAFEMGRRLGATRHGGPVMDAVGQPMFLLDGTARLLRSNPPGEALLRDGTLRLLSGRLMAAVAADEPRLLAAIAGAAGLGGAIPRSASVPLTRRGGGAPLGALLMPLREDADWMALPEPAVLLVIQEAPTGFGQAAARFGLTEAEAAVAEDLLAGLSVAAIAARRGRSINTVRTQLGRLMSKTETRRQVELVRRLTTG